MRPEIVTEVSEPEWREFLSSTPNSNIFQSPQMMRVYSVSRGYRPRLVAAEERGEIRTLMSAAFVSFGFRRLSRFTTRSICIGGPIGEPSNIPELLQTFDATASELAVLSQIRNVEVAPERAAFEGSGYRWEDHHNILIDLEKGEKEVLAGFSRNKRRGIKRAEQRGVQLVDLGRSDMVAGYELLRQTYRRARVPLAHSSLFVNAYEQLQPKGLLWVVAGLLDGVPCSVRFVLRWEETLSDWYAGSSDAGRAARADEWLVWQVLRRGIAAGCKTFDFGGVGPPGQQYGPGLFKRQFGGTEVNPGRFEKVYRPLESRVTNLAYGLWRRSH